MHDRALDPVPDLVIEPGGTASGATQDGRTWLEGYRSAVMAAPESWAGRSLRQLIADAQDDGLLVEDRR